MCGSCKEGDVFCGIPVDIGCSGLMMDNSTSKDGYSDTDLEKGIVSGEVDSRGGNDGSGSVALMVAVTKERDEKRENLVEKIVKEKPKAMSAKKPPKPPRPPRGLSLDSADLKLIRELNELTRLKRARVERMKALKKAKEAKAVSSKNQLFATLLTVVFCVVLLLQGISSRNRSAVDFEGSPTSSAGRSNIISVQPFKSTTHYNDPGSESPRLVEPVSGFVTPELASRAAG